MLSYRECEICHVREGSHTAKQTAALGLGHGRGPLLSPGLPSDDPKIYEIDRGHVVVPYGIAFRLGVSRSSLLPPVD